MFSDLCRGFDLSLAGQARTQSEQPVQSSGATWMVYLIPRNSEPRKAIDWNDSGAPSRASGSKTLARIAAWGQTKVHLLHWMQIFGSQVGISSAMLRFSQRAVPLGHVPSGEKALTGSSSPLPAMSIAVTFCTKSGACSETGAGRLRVAVACAGTASSWRLARVWSTAA
jgi:hypothetical protein